MGYIERIICRICKKNIYVEAVGQYNPVGCKIEAGKLGWKYKNTKRSIGWICPECQKK